MKHLIFIDTKTGLLKECVSVRDSALAEALTLNSPTTVLDEYPDYEFYWDGSSIQKLPEAPSMFHSWSNGKWNDTRSSATVQAARTKEIKDAAQRLLDSKAQERGWDNLGTLLAVRGSSVEEWDKEARDGLQWHASVWQYVNTLPETVTAEDAVNQFPTLRWYNEVL